MTAKIIVTVVKTKGSSPCVVGDKLIVHKKAPISGTIGGGSLEFMAINKAKELLRQNQDLIKFEKFQLVSKLDQCCGGMAEIRFESFVSPQKKDFLTKVERTKNTDSVLITNLENSQQYLYSEAQKDIGLEDQITAFAKKFSKSAKRIEFKKFKFNSQEVLCIFEKPKPLTRVAIFGAGHISRELVLMLIKLPVKIYWIDDRKAQFNQFKPSENLEIICGDFIEATKKVPANAYCLVITYSHKFDFAICRQLLSENNYSYLGLIGSDNKAANFKKNLIASGLSPEKVDRLNCPIGKKRQIMQSPIAIAISIADSLVEFIEQQPL